MSKRILIAEDEQTTREILNKLAALRGYDVIAVTNGIDLLAAAAVEKYDLVITDLMMADLDGVSAANIMKIQGNTTPIIALTGVSAQDIPNGPWWHECWLPSWRPARAIKSDIK